MIDNKENSQKKVIFDTGDQYIKYLPCSLYAYTMEDTILQVK